MLTRGVTDALPTIGDARQLLTNFPYLSIGGKLLKQTEIKIRIHKTLQGGNPSYHSCYLGHL